MTAVGVAAPRRDSGPKVRGSARFAADMPIVGLLHARLVLAHEAHATIASISTDAARALPGVVAVLAAADLPLAASGPGRLYEPLAREEVVYAGQPLAVVVAESEAIAQDGAELVEVELEPLEAVLDLEAAARSGAPRARLQTTAAGDSADMGDAHAAVAAGSLGDDEQLSENVLGTAKLEHGDIDAALAASDAVVRGTFRTPWMYQGYIETQTGTAWLQPDGELVISAATQAPFSARDSLAKLLGMPVDSIRIRSENLGGAFGGKFGLIEPLVGAVALAVGRPVRMAMTRSEDMLAANPAPAEVLTVELGADEHGTLTGIRARVMVDGGANEESGFESIAAMLSAGPYRWDSYELSALTVATNRVTPGAYRAPTAPPGAFAVESLIDELAAQLGIDPLELRLRNVAVEGDRAPSGQTFPIFGARDCLERLRDHPLWVHRDELDDDEGVGIAIGWWPGGYEPAAAACRLDHDGNLTVITGAADMSGVESGFATIAAEAFGIDPSRVRVVRADTSARHTRAPVAAARSHTRSAALCNARRTRRGSGCSRWRPRSSRSRPRTSRSSTARSARRASRRARSRSPIWRRRSSSSVARTRRSRATAASPSRRRHRRRRICRTFASTPTRARSRCCATSSPRMSVGR
jgi:CO/xanthine dehydrogenase Mo-binding subunit